MATAKKTHSPTGMKQDRARVSQQSHEVAYVAERSGASKAAVKAAVKAAGPSRKAVMKKLAK